MHLSCLPLPPLVIGQNSGQTSDFGKSSFNLQIIVDGATLFGHGEVVRLWNDKRTRLTKFDSVYLFQFSNFLRILFLSETLNFLII